MSVNRRNAHTEFSKQQILNDSFDRDYMMLGNEVLTENEAGDALVRQKPIATEAQQDDLITAVNNVSGLQRSTDLEGLGDLSIGTTEVEIAITGTPEEIRIRADKANTGEIFIGKTGVLSDGSNDFIRLDGGDEFTMKYDDTTNALFAISDTVSQKINIGILL